MAKEYPQFDTDEPLWYDNGKWGRAGYAIPNPSGKTFTTNNVIYEFTSIVGRNMMELCHRPDVKFYSPPHKDFWFDLHKLLITARKRLQDRMRTPNDSNGLEPQHVNPIPRTFQVYPVPFFGERIRQPQVREYTGLALMMLGEAMQHSDNDKVAYITPQFAGQMGKYLQEILALMSTMFFGKTRTEAYAADFALKDTDFTTYDPSKFLTSVEMSEERPPQQWWPSENDLSQIRGLPINEALLLSKRWPVGDWLVQADGNVFPDPVDQEIETGGAGLPSNTDAAAAAGSFVKTPGSAP